MTADASAVYNTNEMQTRQHRQETITSSSIHKYSFYTFFSCVARLDADAA